MREYRYRFSLYITLLSICPLFLIGLGFGILSGCSGTSQQAKTSQEGDRGKGAVVELPKIGEIVTTQRALELCQHYDLNHLAGRIEDNPDLFKEWEFDGCSMTPDDVLREIIKVPSLTEICLRHDLGYAYGDPGDQEERMMVDKKFQNELLSAGASEFVAKTMFDAVRVGGKEELCLPFSWSFARVAPCKIGVGFQKK